MAPCPWDAMQEQAPPDLLPLITPSEPPHLLDPARKVAGKMVGLGRRVWRRQGAEARATAEQVHCCQAACLAARSKES
eukprot:1007882-Pelagomonas_calceolata.AAC.1